MSDATRPDPIDDELAALLAYEAAVDDVLALVGRRPTR